MKRFVCREIVKYRNPFPYLEGLVLRVTRRIAMVDLEQRERADDLGTGFTIRKSVSLLANGLTAFSVKPLRVASLLGVFFALGGFALGLSTIVHKLADPAVPAGYSSLMAVVLFSSGTVMLLLGVIGEYVGRIYICLNDSPQYVIKETINLESQDQVDESRSRGLGEAQPRR
jgi:undecaprenyl-phosphate 4-deoxy-4-formamido-L-arabinose transferase